jgi:hypothetical protein
MNVSPLCCLSIALLLLSCSASNDSPQTAAKESSLNEPQIIKLDRFRKALWTVHVTVQGKSGDFLLDTGGGVTLFTDEFAQGFDCKFWGRTTGYNMFGMRDDGPHCDNVAIKAGDIALMPVNVGKFSFGDRFPDSKSPDGILSLDAFDGKAITLDQTNGTLIVESSDSLAKRIQGMQELPLRVSRECSARCLSVYLGVSTPQGMTWLTLDSGAGGVSLIAKEYAEVFGLDPNAKEQRLKHAISPDVRVDSPVIVADMIMDGHLGQPFMSQYLITMDLARSRVWFSRAP